jgi:hypothetical protein
VSKPGFAVTAPEARDRLAPRSEAPARGRALGATAGRLAQAGGLLIAPVAVFLGLQVRPMAASTMIDPYLHTAYVENGWELVHRFGTGNYEWVRVGFILPAHVFWRLFGALGGFFAFRYVLALLAIVPAYLLLKRLHGAVAGWIAVLVVLTCPVILTAWGSDYPDSSAVSYLLGGTACLVMPARPVARRFWVLAAGALLVLAVHSQVVAVLAVGAIVAAYLVVCWRRPLTASLLDVVLLGGAALAVTGLLVLGSRWYYGYANIFTPTIRALILYRQPAEIVKFHSSTWKWLVYDVYLLVPPTAILAWLAMSVRTRLRVPREEVAVVAGLALTLVVFTAAEFIGRSWTLEYYLYTSMLWAGTSLVVAALLARMAGPLLRLGPWALAPAALVVAVPVLLRPLRTTIQFELPVAIAIAAAVVVLVIALRIVVRSRDGAPVRTVLAALAVAGLTVLVTGLPLNRPLFPGQTALFTPDYGSVLFAGGDPTVDDYQVTSEVRTVVPSVAREPGGMLMWWTAHGATGVYIDRAAAQYLWYDDGLTVGLPTLNDAAVTYLADKQPRWLVMMSDDGHEFGPGMQELASRGFTAATWRERTLTSGSVTVHVRVVELTGFPTGR